MAVKFIPGTIAAAATPIKLLDNIPTQGATIIITNGSSGTEIYLGSNSSVTSTNGAVIPPYGIIKLDDVISNNQVWVTTAPAASVGFAVGVIYGDNQ